MKTRFFTVFFSLFFTLELSAGVFRITSDMEIVTTDSTELTKNAASQMKKYLDQILKSAIKITNQIDSNKSSIILVQKQSKYAAKLSFYNELSLLNEDSFIIRSKGKDIIASFGQLENTKK